LKEQEQFKEEKDVMTEEEANLPGNRKLAKLKAEDVSADEEIDIPIAMKPYVNKELNF